ncbi:MAG: phosphoglycerate mutase family protein [Patescibacteria group bacterium]|jgi:phosphohistidine phosphatase SixA|nr:phosphoglycerate mutase family protein [Patescibacteria group bacterium]
MKKLIIVRHGHYDDNLRLSNHGKTQMNELAKKVQANLNGASALILSSSAPRASDSATAMNEVLKVDLMEHEEFWDDISHRGSKEKSCETIEANNHEADAVIVVTHLELTRSIPEYFLKKCGIDGCCYEVGKGEAWEIDFSKLCLTHISP